MTKQARISYGVMVLTLLMVAWLGLATPLLAALFSYLALQTMQIGRSKTVALILFSMIFVVVGYGSVHYFNQAMHAVPKIAEKAIPAVIALAKEYETELPFTDLESLKALVGETVMGEIPFLSKRATIVGKHAVMLIVGFVVAVSLFVNGRWSMEGDRGESANLYSLVCAEVAERFKSLYRSFSTVMGAQLLISAINTTLTSIFVFWIQLPYTGLVIAVTFFCGLLPIVGNLISNTVIVSVAFTITPKMGVAALIFLVVLHKLEYFLNSQIIGSRIKNPMWLTLLGLVIMERLMGIPGMILAPVLLNYIKVEASKIRVEVPVVDGKTTA